MRKLWLVVALFGVPGTLSAQEPPQADLFGGYSFANVRLNSADRSNVNGWNAAVTVNLNPWFGLKTDFGGLYGASTSITFNNVILPCPTPPCSTQQVTISSQGNAHTFLFGPQFSLRREKATPFVHFLIGGALLHSHTTVVSIPEVLLRSSAFDFSFAMALGGGVDFNFRRNLAWRVQTDYVQSAFSNAAQPNFRLSTGLVLHFRK